MYASLIRQSDITRALLRALPELPPAHRISDAGNLFQVLSRNPKPRGMLVHQIRWREKKIQDSYWEVTRAKFKCEGTHGKAWGFLYWKGKRVNSAPKMIPGSLKYPWRPGRSSGKLILRNN